MSLGETGSDLGITHRFIDVIWFVAFFLAGIWQGLIMLEKAAY